MKKIAALVFALCIAFLGTSAPINAVNANLYSGLQSFITQNTHLQNPVGVCYDGEATYIADGGFVHAFTPNGLKSINFSTDILKIRTGGDKLFAESKDILYVYDLTQESMAAVPAAQIKDFEISGDNLYALFDDGIKEIVIANLQNFELKEQGYNIRIDENTEKIAVNGEDIYYLTDEQLNLMEGRYTHDLGINLDDGKTESIMCGCEMLLKFNSGRLELGTTERIDERTLAYKKLGGQKFDFTVTDVYAAYDKVFVINADKLTVISYDLTEKDGAFTLVADGTVYGSNVKNYPTSYPPVNSFEKIEIYKTTQKTFVYAVENGTQDQQWYGYIKENTVVMKLNSNNGFAFVLYRNEEGFDGFGFINENHMTKVAHSAAHQNKVTITSNENIYSLPLYKDEMKIKQNGEEIKINNKQTITVLAEINEFDGGIWVFVEVDGIRGFMHKDRLKNPPVIYPVYEVYIANPAIGQSLAVYKDLNLNEEIARLKSGTQVKVFDAYGNMSKILLNIDGQNVYGWVETEFLIHEGGTTDTVAFGLAIGIIILLTAGFVVVWKFVKNKK